MPFVGAAVRRFEDPRLLRGQGGFIEDLDLPRQLQVAFVRSEHPHARLRAVDLINARTVAGVIDAVAAGAAPPLRGLPLTHAPVPPPALPPCGQPILAEGVVRYVGEPVAAIV